MRATTAFIRLFIRGIAWDAADLAITFQEALKIAASAKLSDSNKGKVLQRSMAGGVEVQFMLPSLGDLGQTDLAEVCSFILDKVDVILAETPGLNDAQLLAALLAKIVPLQSFRPDFSDSRR